MLQTLFAHCPICMLFALKDLQALSCTYRSCLMAGSDAAQQQMPFTIGGAFSCPYPEILDHASLDPVMELKRLLVQVHDGALHSSPQYVNTNLLMSARCCQSGRPHSTGFMGSSLPFGPYFTRSRSSGSR